MAANTSAHYTLNWWERLVYGLIFSIAYLFSLLPLCIHYLFSDFIYFIFYRLVGYRIKVTRMNLTASFPEKSEKEIIDIERRYYHFLADYIVETIKLMSMSRKQIKKRMTYEGFDLINDAERNGRSVSLFLGHYGNWEWITSMGLYVLPSTFGGQVYHILENRIFDKLMLYIRERLNAICVPMNEILRKRLECGKKQQPMVMGYISDQVPLWNSIHHWLPFLHHDTPVFTGAEKLTKRFNDIAVYLDISRPRRGYYHVKIVPLYEGDTRNIPDFAITDAYFKALEKTIQRQPELWLWSHNRWKRTREEWEKRRTPQPPLGGDNI